MYFIGVKACAYDPPFLKFNLPPVPYWLRSVCRSKDCPGPHIQSEKDGRSFTVEAAYLKHTLSAFYSFYFSSALYPTESPTLLCYLYGFYEEETSRMVSFVICSSIVNITYGLVGFVIKPKLRRLNIGRITPKRSRLIARTLLAQDNIK